MMLWGILAAIWWAGVLVGLAVADLRPVPTGAADRMPAHDGTPVAALEHARRIWRDRERYELNSKGYLLVACCIRALEQDAFDWEVEQQAQARAKEVEA